MALTKVQTGMLGTGAVLQVVNATLTTVFSTASTSLVATGLTASITPLFTTSKILVTYNIYGNGGTNQFLLSLLRNGATAIFTGSGGANNFTGATYNNSYIDSLLQATVGSYLDSPATTSATSYAIYGLVTGGTGYINRAVNNPNNVVVPSSITLMEIAA